MKHSNNVKTSFVKNCISEKEVTLKRRFLLFKISSNKTFIKSSKSLFLPSSFLKSVLIFMLFFIFLVSFCLTFTACDAITNLTGNLSKLKNLENKANQDKNSENIQQSENTEITEDKNSNIGSEDTTSAETGYTEEKANTSEPLEENTDGTNTPKEITIDPALQTINVYYANSTGEYLVGEARDVEGSSKLVDAIYEMMKEPIDPSLVVLIPSTTKINSVKAYENGIAKIDLSQSFLDDRFQSDTVDILLVYSIVNTLTEFKEVQAVEFYIDGKKLDILGQLDIKGPVYRRSDLIKQ